MNYINVSFTHKNTDISIREKLAFSSDEKKREILRLMNSNVSIAECMVLNTCNRVEVFAFVSDLEKSKIYILRALSILSGVALSELEDRADIFYSSGAIHHLFAVASSLDSLVIGETQIAGQIKDAIVFANNLGCCGANIARAIEFAFKCAAKVRNSTQISKNPVSVSSVAVSKAKEIFENLNNINTLVVGAGDMSALACKHLLSCGANITIINRSQEKAIELANSLGQDVKVLEINNLYEAINSYPLIFSATSSPEPIITNSLIQNVSFDRYFFDIAVPRDIEIQESDKIKVYSVDDLQEIVKINLALREEQAQVAYSIVGKDTNNFFKHLKILASTPIIKSIRQRAKDISEIEIQKAIKRGYLKNCDKDEAKKLIHQVFKSFLHRPTINIKNLSEDDDSQTIMSVLEQIFELEVELDYENFNIEDLEKINEI